MLRPGLLVATTDEWEKLASLLPGPQGSQVLRTSLTVSADDPDLPSELLPDDWPGDQLAAAIGRAFRVFVPLMVDYLGTLTSGKRLPGG
jgi:hypothetical protein